MIHPERTLDKPNLLQSALTYHAHGWTVIPIGSKKAAGDKWTRYQDEQPNEATLRQWFGRPRYNGLAVIFGAVSGGLVCRDYDIGDAYLQWARSNANLAALLPTAETKRGYHVYFRGPEAYAELDDGEYRGTSKQYCVLPPSLHPSGIVYRWVVDPFQRPLPTIDPVREGLIPEGSLTHATERTEEVYEAQIPNQSSQWHGIRDQLCEWGEGVEQAVCATIPDAYGKRHRSLFALVRKLKALANLAEADPVDLEPIVRVWHRLALPSIRTQEWEISWVDFRDGWTRAKQHAGQGPLADALRAVQSEPLPAVARRYQSAKVQLLVALCARLSADAGEGVFYLGCRTAGECVGVDYKTGWRYLHLLEMDRVLTRVSTGSLDTGRVNRWRFTAEQREGTT